MVKIINKKTPFISIIVPVYNVEKYLDRCLDSIFSQRVTGDFEVIAVDDGSTDNSLNVLKKYQEKESRLIIIEHGCNKKLSIARSTGMKIATGDYIMHVDSDDWLMPKALECLKLKIKQTAADVIVFNYLREDLEGKKTFVRKIKKEQILIDKELVQSHFYGACWSKIVKRSITDELVYGQKGINNGEDLLYASEILIRADKIALITEFIYIYFVNNNSLTQTTTIAINILTLTNITHALSILLVHYKQTRISQNLYNLRLQYSIDFISKNIFSIRSGKFDLNPLIMELEEFPNIKKTKINLSKLSNNTFYFISQFFFGRIKLKNILHFFRNLFVFNKIHFQS